MISIRSVLSKSLVGGRGSSTQNAAAAFMQANVPIPSSPSSSNSIATPTTTSTTSTSVRHLSSPAYRRYLLKKTDKKNTNGLKPVIPAHWKGIQTPTLEVAQRMPWAFSEMENEPLVVIAEMGNHNARKEVLRRHIMMIDSVEYEEADKTLEKIAAKNRENMIYAALPYKIGIALAMGAGFGAFPMVFDVDVALWFNDKYVTMEIPPPSDLDTSLETGAWTWNWMEPVLGTASFTLLCFQFTRQQIKNLGLKPYTQKLIETRAQSLYEAFPQYDATMLHSFVETDKMA